MRIPRQKFRWLGALLAVFALVTVDVIKVGNAIATEVQTDVAKVVKAEITDQTGAAISSSPADADQILHLELDLDTAKFNDTGFISLELTPTTVSLANNEQEITPEISGEKQAELKLKYGYNESKKSYGLSYDKSKYSTIQNQIIKLDFKVPVTTASQNINTAGDEINLKIGGNQAPHLIGSMVIKAASESSSESQTSSESQSSEESAVKEESGDEDGESDTTTTEKINDEDRLKGMLTEDPSGKLGEAKEATRATIQMNTFASGFDIYSKNAQNSENIQVATGKTGGNGTYTDKNGVLTEYYRSYNSGGNASVVMYTNNNDLTNEEIVVDYNHVGTYVDSSGDSRQMGAMLKVTSIIPGVKPNWSIDNPYIDFSNNFYSGMVYGRISQMDITVTYYDTETLNRLDVQTSANDYDSSFFTFGSLNGHEEGREGAKSYDNLEALLSENTIIEATKDGWYEGVENYFDDYLGSVDFENSTVAFKIKGQDHKFAIRSGYGFTWQSFMSASVSPIAPDEPTKTVTESKDPDGKNELDIRTAGQGDKNLSNPKIENHSYFIYQPTYELSETTVAKPDNIIMEDTLPPGVTLVTADASSVKLFNTNGEEITVDVADDNLEIGVDNEGHQTIKYTLNDDQIKALTFNGQSFAYRLDVKVDHARYEGKHHIMENSASVTFDSGEGATWTNPTNKVATQLVPDEEVPEVDANLIKYGQSKNNLDEYNTPLAGVSFRITGENMDSEISTKEDGTIQFNNLIPGIEYTLKEIKTIDGYIPFDGEIKFTVDKDGKVTIKSGPANINNNNQIVVHNELVMNDKTFMKIDADETDKVLENAEFIIRKPGNESHYAQFEANKFIGWTTDKDKATKFTSGEDGKFKIGEMPYGTYQLQEINPPAGYAKPESYFGFTINENSDQTEDIRTIPNHRYGLPVTGGLGIWILISAGLLAMGTSWYLYHRTKKQTL
ncbi:prealbumin-like fold domain-containing protein [Paucilactobacillus kaifaensis]|uniref:prealbumin-like fold domain-containing protein n=1 Tax=Paucilactobacillus kaifaensis TaxID=2559921 RepID=UPI0010F4F4C2|nr:prealbumin-like fold domain-containing protein [Paucilactobacillus kaifaensis]